MVRIGGDGDPSTMADQPDPIRTAAGAPPEEQAEEQRRDRLLAGLTLTGAAGLALALPFALQAGAEFFLPVVTAIVIAIALVPFLEWLERRRMRSGFAALLCVVLFLAVLNGILVLIVVPASGWFQLLPERIPVIRDNLSVVIDLYSSLQQFIDRTLATIATVPASDAPQLAMQPPGSLLSLIATSAPHALIQMVFAILVIYFFLANWTRLRRSVIEGREDFRGALTMARVIQNVVDATSAYLATITAINITLGLIVAAALWGLDMPTPLMWGGIVAMLNFVPYLGPILAAVLLTLGGLMSFQDIGTALVPAAIMVGLHLVEANVVTPVIVGRRLTLEPLLILISLSFWTWVWGTLGALLAVPLLIIIRVVVAASGKPDIAGFLFEEGTLTHAGRAPSAPPEEDA